MQPLKVSCLDHEGGGAVKFLQWDGKQVERDHRLDRVRPVDSCAPMIEASAAQYAKEKSITPRDCSKEK